MTAHIVGAEAGKEAVFQTRVSGDVFDRYVITGDGTRQYGDGTAVPAALTDSSGGTASNTLAATAGISTLIHPLTSLATGLSTSAIDLMTGYTPGYKFKLLGMHFVTTVAGTGASASQVFNLEIGTTNVTGGVLTLLLADTDTIGKITAATAITAANTGSASDTISLEMAASGTVFTAGAGYFAIRIQNMDVADALASLARRS
jgi:hypothetical protein